jgi:hypothetical protein
MRYADIIPTTPEHSTLYAHGTNPETKPQVWIDPRNEWKARPYSPAYVLKLDQKSAVILTRRRSPYLSPLTEYSYETGERTDVVSASLLEALEYTLTDWEIRQGVLAEFSHWAQDDKEAKGRLVVELAKLKPIPAGWMVSSSTLTNIRMLWADYTSRMEEKAKEREVEEAKRRAAALALQARADKAVKGLNALARSAGVPSKNLTTDGFGIRHHRGWSEVEVHLDVAEALIKHFGKKR